MEDRVQSAGERSVQFVDLAHITLDEPRCCRDVLSQPRGEVVKYNRLVPVGYQAICHVRANEPGSACYQNSHDLTFAFSLVRFDTIIESGWNATRALATLAD